MTQLTPEQLATVIREIESMDSESEVWRILTMFAEGRFNYGLEALPKALRDRHRRLGPGRRNSHADLVFSFRGVLREHGRDVFDMVVVGTVPSDGRDHELIKVVSKPSASPYATRLPICLIAGVHGDEVDSIWAAHEFARRFCQIPELVSTYALTIYPCINPTGFERMTRENGNGKDLNREFGRGSREVEVEIMERELGGQEFTGFISGHSDYESFGLYAYATGPVISERLAKPALFQASGIIPINTDPVIDGHPASYGIISEKFPGSLGPLTKGKTEPFDITIETPNLFALRKRVEAQAIAFETILQEYRAVAAEGMYL